MWYGTEFKEGIINKFHLEQEEREKRDEYHSGPNEEYIPSSNIQWPEEIPRMGVTKLKGKLSVRARKAEDLITDPLKNKWSNLEVLLSRHSAIYNRDNPHLVINATNPKGSKKKNSVNFSCDVHCDFIIDSDTKIHITDKTWYGHSYKGKVYSSSAIYAKKEPKFTAEIQFTGSRKRKGQSYISQRAGTWGKTIFAPLLGTRINSMEDFTSFCDKLNTMINEYGGGGTNKMIRKKDYSDTYRQIIRELNLRGFRGMANYLEANPPQMTNLTGKNEEMLSSDVVDRLFQAKESSNVPIVISELKSLKGPEFRNILQMITTRERKDAWKDQLRRD